MSNEVNSALRMRLYFVSPNGSESRLLVTNCSCSQSCLNLNLHLMTE